MLSWSVCGCRMYRRVYLMIGYCFCDFKKATVRCFCCLLSGHRRRSAPIHFACTNFPSGNARKTGGFAGRGKTSNFFEKFACIGNPLLVSYSPVAPLRATPGATRRSIFEKRTVLKNAIPRFPAREPSEGTRNTMNRYACCDARNPARGFNNLNKFFF